MDTFKNMFSKNENCSSAYYTIIIVIRVKRVSNNKSCEKEVLSEPIHQQTLSNKNHSQYTFYDSKIKENFNDFQ